MKKSSQAKANPLLDKTLMKTFPKVELHRHLEGMFSLKHLFELSIKNNLGTPRNYEEFEREFQFPKDSGPDFLLFLSKFKRFWYRSLDDIDYIVYHSILTLKEEGLIYLELRFAPDHFAEFNNFDRCEVTKVVIDAADRAAKEINLTMNYLLTFNRMFQTAQQMIEDHKKIDQLGLSSIVGIDLAGDEVRYPPELFIPFFDYIKSLGKYKIDIHAGETVDESHIWSAIRNLHADRIGHGISAINDPKLLEYIKEKGIYLCQCITSNFQTGAWVESDKHPLAELYQRGYPVCINSDDPSIQDTDLTDDYIKCVEYFHFNAKDFFALNLNAINSAFIDEEGKQSLRDKLEKGVESFTRTYL